ncbi:MAG: hypothetical protein JO353_06760 [Phycisphaerae bacterium]|nr:hypothetical protein [Phycisphaerae bacterium]
MRVLRYLPIAYVAGVHGFAFFAPYLAIFLALTHFLRKRAIPIPVRTFDPIRAN